MSIYFLYFGIFAAALLAFEALAITLGERRRRQGTINRRLRVLQTQSSARSALSILRKERWLDDEGRYRSPLVWLNRLFVQTGLVRSPIVYLLGVVLGCLLLALGTWLWFNSIGLSVVLFITSASAILVFAPQALRNRRINAFTQQLPEALDVMVRSLRAGHPVSTAIALVAREMPDPAGTEFGILSDELTYGSELDDALEQLIERVGAEELRLFATSTSLQKSTGGNLAEILANLSNVIRERIQMRAKIRALSVEGRMTAWFMTAFPFIIFLVINFLAPHYYDVVWESGLFVHATVFCIAMLAIGDYILFRLVRFDF